MAVKPRVFIFLLALLFPLLASAQERGLNDRLTNDLSHLPAMDAVVIELKQMKLWKY